MSELISHYSEHTNFGRKGKRWLEKGYYLVRHRNFGPNKGTICKMPIEDVQELYSNGWSLRVIAEQYKVSRRAISGLFRYLGFSVRAKTDQSKIRQMKRESFITQKGITNDTLKKLYIDEKLPIGVIAKNYSVAPATIWHYLGRFDIPIRNEAEHFKLPELRKRSLEKRPMTEPEQRLANIIVDNDLPWKYVGNGGLIIDNLCPDFVHESKRELIEVFGSHWHFNRLPGDPRDETTRIERLNAAGYRVLVLWDHDLSDMGAVIQKIGEFSHD